MYNVDVAVTQMVNGWAGQMPLADFVMIWLSSLGVPVLVLAVGLQWWRRANRPGVRHTLVASGLSFLLGLALNQVILLLVHRIRPYDQGVTHLLIAPSADPSFPSDHATAAIAIAATFLLHGQRRTGLAFLAAALLVMISRVYIGTHYASDVVGGALTAALASIVISIAYRPGTKADRLITGIL